MSELTSFEIMTDKRLTEVESTLVDIQNMLHKLYHAVVGDNEFDQEGLIARIKKLEKENESTKAFRNKLIGMSTAGGATLAGVFELIKYIVEK